MSSESNHNARHTVFRAAEGMAHGLLSWLWWEIVFFAVVGVVFGLVANVVVGIGVAIVAAVGAIAGRRLWDGRREYALLYSRRWQGMRHQRMLDVDAAYRPYPSAASQGRDR